MINEYAYFNEASPASMDYLWAQGWRHFGGYFFRYSSISQGSKSFSVLPLRICLKAFISSRSQKEW